MVVALTIHPGLIEDGYSYVGEKGRKVGSRGLMKDVYPAMSTHLLKSNSECDRSGRAK